MRLKSQKVAGYVRLVQNASTSQKRAMDLLPFDKRLVDFTVKHSFCISRVAFTLRCRPSDLLRYCTSPVLRLSPRSSPTYHLTILHPPTRHSPRPTVKSSKRRYFSGASLDLAFQPRFSNPSASPNSSTDHFPACRLLLATQVPR